jgi:hypothetical protein
VQGGQVISNVSWTRAGIIESERDEAKSKKRRNKNENKTYPYTGSSGADSNWGPDDRVRHTADRNKQDEGHAGGAEL